MSKTKNPYISSQQYNAALPQYIRDFASGQVLSNLAYSLQNIIDKHGTLQENYFLLEPTGAWKGYEVQPIAGVMKGLHGFVFTQVESKDHHTDPNLVKIAFRGTQMDWSIMHDFDPFGPGFTAFQEGKDLIIEELDAAIAGKSNVELTLSGHSLGGSHATYLLIEILKDHHASGKYGNIRKITLDTFNAPSSYDAFFEEAQDILKLNAESKYAIDVEVNIGVSDKDAIQHVGHNIFDQLNPMYANIQMVKTDTIEILEDSVDPLDPLGIKIFYDVLQGFEYYLSHTITENYFAPAGPQGRINPDLKHEYWNNQHLNGKVQIDHQLESKGPTLTSGILDTILLPGKIIRDAAEKLRDEVKEGLSDAYKRNKKMNLNLKDIFSDMEDWDLFHDATNCNKYSTRHESQAANEGKSSTSAKNPYACPIQDDQQYDIL